MNDDHPNQPEVPEASGDRSVEPRAQDLRPTDSGPDGNGPGSVGGDRSASADRGQEVLPDESITAEIPNESLRKELVSRFSEARIGPLPTPEELAKYQDLSSRAFDCIINMADRSNDAAVKVSLSEARVNEAIASRIEAEGKSIGRGQWVFAVLALVIVLTGGVLAYHGNTNLAGLSALVGALFGLGVLVQPRIAERWSLKPSQDEN